jgi:hypothetical protein
MAFKRSLSALVFALPLVFGLSLKQRNSCDFLRPIVTDLLDNLFTRECGEAVSLFPGLVILLTLCWRPCRLMVLFVSSSMTLSESAQHLGTWAYLTPSIPILNPCNQWRRSRWIHHSIQRNGADLSSQCRDRRCSRRYGAFRPEISECFKPRRLVSNSPQSC